MPSRLSIISLCFSAAALCVPVQAQTPAQAPLPATAPAPEMAGNLYAVEITVGSAWDPSKKPNEQAYFKEHSANLQQLRHQGRIVVGARYADKGLVILNAVSEQDAHAMMQQDPAIQNKVFVYQLHPFNVFYPGNIPARKRP